MTSNDMPSKRPAHRSPADRTAATRDHIAATSARARSLLTIDPVEAGRLATEMLAAARLAGDEHAEASALEISAHSALLRSRHDDALELGEAGLAIAARIADRHTEAALLTVLSAIHRRIGRLEDSETTGLRGLELARATDDRRLVAIALQGLGNLFRHRGRVEHALELHRESLAIATEIGARADEANALLGIGSGNEALARYAEALESFRACLRISEEIGDHRLAAYADGNIANVFQLLGDNSTALVHELKSLRAKDRENDSWGIGVSLNNLGLIYRNLGDYASALEAMLGSLNISERIGDRPGEAVALNNIGETHEMLGDRTLVLDYYLRSLRISQTTGHRQGEAYSLLHIGRFYHHLGDDAMALLHYFRSLRILEEIGDLHGERELLRSIGEVYVTLGDEAKGEEYLLRSLDLTPDTSNVLGKIETLMALGQLHDARGDHERSIAIYLRASETARASGARDGLRLAAGALAKTCERAGDHARAAEFRKLHADCTREIFDSESTRRVREMMISFQGNRARRQGQILGLQQEDIEEINAAMRRARATRREARAESVAPGMSARPSTATVVAAGTREAPGIVVRTLGKFRVIIDGRELATADWRRKRARDLFKLLLIHHRRALTSDEILEMLWKGAAGRGSISLVMNAVSHIRRAIEPERGAHKASAILSGGDGAYMLDLGEGASIDFLEFKALIVAARRGASAEERRDQYERAVALYHGDFLREDLYEEWAAPERELLKDAFLEGMEFLAADMLRSGRSEETIETARRILQHDRTNERAYELLLLALRERGRGGEARKVYAECAALFRSELGVDPPDRLRAVAESDG